MTVGQPFVDFILEHHPDSSRKLTGEEAATLLQEERVNAPSRAITLVRDERKGIPLDVRLM